MTGVWEIVKILECREAGLNKKAAAKLSGLVKRNDKGSSPFMVVLTIYT